MPLDSDTKSEHNIYIAATAQNKSTISLQIRKKLNKKLKRVSVNPHSNQENTTSVSSSNAAMTSTVVKVTKTCIKAQ